MLTPFAFGVKNIGKPYALIAHIRFDEGGQARACPLLYPLISLTSPFDIN